MSESPQPCLSFWSGALEGSNDVPVLQISDVSGVLLSTTYCSVVEEPVTAGVDLINFLFLLYKFPLSV